MSPDIRLKLRQILTDFQNSFTAELSIQRATNHLSYFPPHLKSVATLPSEIQTSNFANYRPIVKFVTESRVACFLDSQCCSLT